MEKFLWENFSDNCLDLRTVHKKRRYLTPEQRFDVTVNSVWAAYSHSLENKAKQKLSFQVRVIIRKKAAVRQWAEEED